METIVNYSEIKRKQLSKHSSATLSIKGAEFEVEYDFKKGARGNYLTAPDPDELEIISVSGDVLYALDEKITRVDIQDAIERHESLL